MPVISFVSTKGGVGKTTTALALAGAFANSGSEVILMDGDPNQPISTWHSAGGVPSEINVMGGITEKNVIDGIDHASTQAPFVLVDCEGSANMTLSYAVMKSDFVIIPCQGSHLDAVEAMRSIEFIQNAEKVNKRKIPYAVLFTRTSMAIRGGSQKYIEQDFEAEGIRTFSTELIDREAFRAMTSIGGTVFQLKRSDVSGLPAAKENANAIANELIGFLKPAKKTRKSGKKAA